MNKRLVLTLLTVGAMIGMAWTLQMRTKRTIRQVEDASADVPTWDQAKAREAAKGAEADWAKAMAALDAPDFKAAFLAYRDAKEGAFGRFASAYPDKELEPGVTLKAWTEKRDQAYREKFMPPFEKLVDVFSQGDVPFDEFRQVIDNHDVTGFKRPGERYKEREPAVARARARAAGRWLRVTFVENSPDYHEAIMRALRVRWGSPNGLRLVFGGALSPLEEASTWRRIEVHVDQQSQEYVLDEKQSNWKGITPPSIPYHVVVGFKVEGDADDPTTWDRLPVITAHAEAPQNIVVTISADKELNQAQEIERQNRHKLLEQITAGLREIPAFEPYPGLDPATIQVKAADGLDFVGAHALAYHAPENLAGQLGEISRDRDPLARAGAALLAISLGVEPLAPWVAKALPSMDQEVRLEAARALKRRPDYGGFAPLAALISPAAGEPPWEAIEAIHGQLDDPRLREAVMARVGDPKNPRRADMARSILAQASPEEVLELGKRWAIDPDPNFATQVWVEILNKNRDLATDVAIEAFDQATPQARERMLSGFEYRADKHGERGIEILTKAALDRKDEPTRQSALAALAKFSYQAPAWEALQRVAGTETEPRRREHLQMELVMNVRRAVPEKARDYLARRAKDAAPNVRRVAVNELLSDDGPKDDLLRDLAEQIDAGGGDALLREVVLSVRQYHTLRKGWDLTPENETLRSLLSRAARHPETQVRRAAYEVMGKAGYADLLEAALATETDGAAKTMIQDQIKNASKPANKP